MARPLTMSADLFSFCQAGRQRQAIRGSLSGYVVQAARQPEGRCRHLGPDWLKHTMAKLKQYELTLLFSSCFLPVYMREHLLYLCPLPGQFKLVDLWLTFEEYKQPSQGWNYWMGLR